MKKEKLTAQEIEEMAVEIRKYLLDNHLWLDTAIFFNGKAFSTCEKFGEDCGEIANNNGVFIPAICKLREG